MQELFKQQKICVCGGGALGHVICGTLAQRDDCQVNLLTGHPGQWGKYVSIAIVGGGQAIGKLGVVSSEAKDVIPDMDYIILCLPGYMISSTLRKIVPFLKEGATVGSVVCSNGFFWMAKSLLPDANPYFGLQRVPYIARVKEYGHSAELKGFKDEIKISISKNGNRETIRKAIEGFFGTPTKLLKSFWSAALTNSNPLLHTARLYVLFKNYTSSMVYSNPPLFYEDWDEESSNLLIACDNEFQEIIKQLPFESEEIPRLLTHYESSDAASLTRKLISIPAFKGIRLKMVKVEGGYIPDWNNRYFTEDIPYGLLIIRSFGAFFNIETPCIDEILTWAQIKMGKEYLVDGLLVGKDMAETGVPVNYVSSMQDLLTWKI